MTDEYVAVKRGKLILKDDKPKSRKRKHKKKENSIDSKVDEDSIKHGGWWRVDKVEDITGPISIEFGNGCYVSALDNGLFTIGAPHGDGEGPSPEEIFTAFPAGETKFALKSGYGKYLGVSKEGAVIGRSDAVGPMEQWEPVWQDGKTAILSALNKFVSINLDDDSLVARSITAGDTEFCCIRSNKTKEENTTVLPIKKQVGFSDVDVNYVIMSECQHDDAVAGPSHERVKDRLLPSYPCALTPGGAAPVQGDRASSDATPGGRIRTIAPTVTPWFASPVLSAVLERKRATPKRRRRAQMIGKEHVIDNVQDSGSDDDDRDIEDFFIMREAARKLRDVCVRDQVSMLEEHIEDGATIGDIDRSPNRESESDENKDKNCLENIVDMDVLADCELIESEDICMEENQFFIVEENVNGVDERIENENVVDEKIDNANVVDERIENVNGKKTAPVDTNFLWVEDFTSFTAQKESYSRVPGSTFSSQDPVAVFCEIWDRGFMETVVRETNQYACEIISQLSEPDMGTGIPKHLDSWTDTTVDELYRYFAVLIYISFCHRSSIKEYWDTGILGMSSFRKIMSRNRFLLLTKFLHFASNKNLVSRGYNRKIEKVAPVLDHCNRKFAEMYTPSQYLSLDESVLLWKGNLSWKQCVRSKAARFGIKSFELCEAATGYLLQYRLYTGKDTVMNPGLLHGFNDKTAQVVLELMEGYLDAGHVLVMDNWYNQLPLTRYLKSRRTDVLGTMNRRRVGIPEAIKALNPKQLKRGESVSRHCGDIALVAWKDVKLVTLISTYHQHEMVTGSRAGQPFLRPVAVQDYNQYMGGVDLKDQKLSMFLLERKRCQKWYMKVFRRLLNTSFLNAYIIYLRNPMHRVYTHRQFRLKVAEGLLSRFPDVSSVPPRVQSQQKMLSLRLQPGNHFPGYTTMVGKKHKQMRCVRCRALKKRVVVTIMCKLCQVPLCLGKCWAQYHSVKKL